MYCEECGHNNNNGNKFCAECGKKLKDYTKTHENTIPVEDVKSVKVRIEKKNAVTKRFNIAIYFTLFAAIVLTVVSFLAKNTAQTIIISVGIGCYLLFFILAIIKRKLMKKYKV